MVKGIGMLDNVCSRYEGAVETWKSKLVVDDPVLHLTMRSSDKVAQQDRYKGILHDPAMKKSLKGLYRGKKPLVGGDTVFHATAKTECARVSPEAGMALLHAHGRRCLMHEAEEVRRGAKYLLRADVMYRRVRDDGPAPRAHLEAAPCGAWGP